MTLGMSAVDKVAAWVLIILYKAECRRICAPWHERCGERHRAA